MQRTPKLYIFMMMSLYDVFFCWLGPGGSTSGEGVLIAGGGGSILGYGSDLGGSIRIPSACCGVCTVV